MILHLALLGLATLSTAVGTVKTSQGTITGGTCSSTNAEYFFSIPYAEPPTSILRFAAPRPFNGTYPSKLITKAPSCNQFGTLFDETGIQSEDW